MKKTLQMIIFFTLLIFLSACGLKHTNTLEKLQDEGKVVVGFADEKPYGYENEDGELTGASVETAKAVFKELGIEEVEGHLADYSELVPGLGARKFDAITSGMAITPERCDKADFSDADTNVGGEVMLHTGATSDQNK